MGEVMAKKNFGFEGKEWRELVRLSTVEQVLMNCQKAVEEARKMLTSMIKEKHDAKEAKRHGEEI